MFYFPLKIFVHYGDWSECNVEFVVCMAMNDYTLHGCLLTYIMEAIAFLQVQHTNCVAFFMG